MSLRRREFLAAVAGAACARPALGASGWRAGMASLDITPPPGVWMAGFAARKEPSRGTALPLHAKALALEDAGGRRAVIVTFDVLGLTEPVVERIADQLQRRHGLARESVLLCSSHTHCGPVIDDQLAVAYDLTAAQWDAVRAATRTIESRAVEVVGHALRLSQPARLRYGSASAGFVANRRTAFPGPIDATVPVLAIEGPHGGLAGVVFGYACHNTTLPATFVEYHGDYAGVAQRELERRHRGATAFYVAGCGADANPSPRGTVELVEAHGRALADAVARGLRAATALDGRLRTAFATAALKFAPPPPPEAWRANLEADNPYVRRHARLMLDAIERDGQVQAFERAPLHVLRIGGLTMVAIGGEVVVDYAISIKRLHGGATWVAGYTDSVFGYLPSLRVLREGGYEGGEAMLYYGRPGPFAENVESVVLSKVDALIGATGGGREEGS
jgi:hypothetical protein